MAFDNPYIPNVDNILSQHQRGLATGQHMREQNTLSQAGERFAQGDQSGTVNALAKGGMLDKAVEMQNQFRAAASTAEADKLAKAQRANEVLGNLAMLADTPEKWAVAFERAKAAGLDVDQWQDFGTRDFVLAQAGKAKEVLDMELARRKEGSPFKVVGKGGRVFNEQTQQWIEPPGGTADPVEGAKFEQDLREEYAALSKNFRSVQEGVDRVEAGAKLNNAVGDLSLIFGYMKLLDPGSVVREGEFANAENAQGVPDRIRNVWNKIIAGERLNPSTRQEFVAAAKELGTSQMERQSRLTEQFRGISADAGVDPERVIMDFGPKKEAPAAVPGGPGAPQPGQIEDGYRFKGGEPSDPANWERAQ
jgi:hypothetical protein